MDDDQEHDCDEAPADVAERKLFVLLERIALSLEEIAEGTRRGPITAPSWGPSAWGATVGGLRPMAPSAVREAAARSQALYEEHDRSAAALSLSSIADDLNSLGLHAKITRGDQITDDHIEAVVELGGPTVEVRLAPTPRPYAHEPFLLSIRLQRTILVRAHTTTHERLLHTVSTFLAG